MCLDRELNWYVNKRSFLLLYATLYNLISGYVTHFPLCHSFLG